MTKDGKPEIYFISDTHFNDRNILIYSRSEFKNIEEMNDVIVKNWNNTVGKEDIVYHLGDFGDYNFLDRLNGNIIIIKGNHDDEEKLKAVRPDIKFYDKPIVFLGPQVPYLNIHGHLHQFDYRMTDSLNWYDGNRYFNVSCEKINYTPINVMDIIDLIGYKNM